LVLAVAEVTPPGPASSFDECIADLLLSSDLSDRYLARFVDEPTEFFFGVAGSTDSIEDRRFLELMSLGGQECPQAPAADSE
jgi:hypothetical protein